MIRDVTGLIAPGGEKVVSMSVVNDGEQVMIFTLDSGVVVEHRDRWIGGGRNTGDATKIPKGVSESFIKKAYTELARMGYRNSTNSSFDVKSIYDFSSRILKSKFKEEEFVYIGNDAIDANGDLYISYSDGIYGVSSCTVEKDCLRVKYHVELDAFRRGLIETPHVVSVDKRYGIAKLAFGTLGNDPVTKTLVTIFGSRLILCKSGDVYMSGPVNLGGKENLRGVMFKDVADMSCDYFTVLLVRNSGEVHELYIDDGFDDNTSKLEGLKGVRKIYYTDDFYHIVYLDGRFEIFDTSNYYLSSFKKDISWSRKRGQAILTSCKVLDVAVSDKVENIGRDIAMYILQEDGKVIRWNISDLI